MIGAPRALLLLAFLAACPSRREPASAQPAELPPAPPKDVEPTTSAPTPTVESDDPSSARVPHGVPTSVAGAPIDPDAANRPIAEVKANALYAPDPDTVRLADTAAARARKPVVGSVRFCVPGYGKATDVLTVLAVDDEIDGILRDTVAKWRFKPFMVDGKPATTCSVVVFKISFK